MSKLSKETLRQLRRMEGNWFERMRFRLFGEFRIFFWIVGLIIAFSLSIGYTILHFIVKNW